VATDFVREQRSGPTTSNAALNAIALIAMLFLVTTGSRGAQPAPLLVRVVENASLRALPNAEVIDVESGVRRFTNDRGEARIPWPSSRRLTLRLRQIGFKFVERTVERTPNEQSPDTLTVALERVVFALPEVVTREPSQCAGDDDRDSLAKVLSIPALEQLRVGAERFEAFRKTYPFRIEQERRTVTVGIDGKPKAVRRSKEQADSDEWGDPYIPGKIVHRTPLGFSVPILFVAALADSAFWNHHCFAALGIETLGDQRVVRLQFAPARAVPGPEWDGTAFIDSTSGLLRRVEFRLIGLSQRDNPRRFEGYTTFASPSPYIAIPDSTVAMWWRNGPRSEAEWGMPDIVQLVHVLQIRYRKGRPP